MVKTFVLLMLVLGLPLTSAGEKITVKQGKPETVKRVVVDDFSSYKPQSFPKFDNNYRWHIFSLTNFKTQNYWVEEEQGNRFLRAEIKKTLPAKKKSMTLIRRFRKAGHTGRDTAAVSDDNGGFYHVQEYPYLSWKWGVLQFPQGGDERDAEKNDSAAGVYVYFQKKGQLPKVIKYIWSSTLSVGTQILSPSSRDGYDIYFIVVKSGAAPSSGWAQEVRDVYKDYLRCFNNEQPPRVVGIGVLTDADSTDTEASADYDDFIFLSALEQKP